MKLTKTLVFTMSKGNIDMEKQRYDNVTQFLNFIEETMKLRKSIEEKGYNPELEKAMLQRFDDKFMEEMVDLNRTLDKRLAEELHKKTDGGN